MAPGIYAPETNGEEYPLTMKSGVTLTGSPNTELRAAGMPDDSGIIDCYQVEDAEISGFLFRRDHGKQIGNRSPVEL